MSSVAFPQYLRFVMSKYKIADYNIRYKIAVNFPLSKNQIDIIYNMGNTNGLVSKEDFYNAISTFTFLDNQKTIEGEHYKEDYYIKGEIAKNVEIPEELSFEIDNTFQKILNVPAYFEYLKTMKELKKDPINNAKKIKQLTNYKNTYLSENDKVRYIKKTYNIGYKLIDEDYLNNKKQVLQLPEYDKENCEYSNHSYKFTYGVLIYLEDDENVCPICYSESNNPHTILDNFKIVWDSVGIISLEDVT